MPESFFGSEFDTMREGPPIPGTFPPTEIETNVSNYWGATPEKQFVLPFWEADQLINASTTSELALKVINISNATQVEATWVSQNPTDSGDTSGGSGGFVQWLINLLNSLLPSPPEEDANYYVIGPSLYQTTGTENFKQFTPHTRMALVARIGRTASGAIRIYFNVCELVRRGSGPGGPGTITGAKVPSGDDDA